MRTSFACAALVTLCSVGVAQSQTTAAPISSADWPLIGRNEYQQHYSPLLQISDKTVKSLGLAWSVDMPTPDGMVGVPLISGGVVFQSGTLGMVFANDLRTGKLLWSFDPQIQFAGNSRNALWGGRVNRGLALWENKVIVGVGDCRLVAVDRDSGKQVWEAKACDPTEGHIQTLTGAPRVGGGKVFIGMAGGDGGARGFVNAFDAATGRHLWRFYTVPGEDDKGFPNADPETMARAKETWGAGYKPAGAAPWDALTYDPKTNLLLVGTSAPAAANPLARGTKRGDELFTNSILALHADTGKYAWHYQVTPNDAWDYEATQHIMLADLMIQGKMRHVAMQAPKNGFLYVVDALTGKLISANNFVPVFWASHVDLKTGRPVQRPEAQWYNSPGKFGFIQPNGPNGGAHSFEPMSYSSSTGLVYFPAVDVSNRIRSNPKSFLSEVDLQSQYAALGDSSLHADGRIIAWDPLAQQERWHANIRSTFAGGMLSTAGNLVFGGTGTGEFSAYNSANGQLLWSFDTLGSCIQGTPVTVEIDNTQFVVVPSGSCSSSGAGRVVPLLFRKDGTVPKGPSRLLAFRLGGNAVLPPTKAIEPVPKPPLPRFSAAQAQVGEGLFGATMCVTCHGEQAIASVGSVPDLRRASAQTHQEFTGIVLGARRDRGMPSFADILSVADVQAIQAYVINQAWKAYDAENPSSGQGH